MTVPVLAVAHRAGNSLLALREAVALGVDVLECDVHGYRGRLEVRHLKTAGPLPYLWDRWELVPASAPRLVLPELLEAERRGVTVMLDLKGPRTSTARAVARVLQEGGHGDPVLVCGRFWRSVELAGELLPGALPVLSARNRGELALLRRRLRPTGRRPRPPTTIFGVSLHLRLVEPDVVAELRGTVERVLTWPVNDVATLDAVVQRGVNGVISDDATVLAELVRRNAAAQ